MRNLTVDRIRVGFRLRADAAIYRNLARCILLLPGITTLAATVELRPVADTTLIEAAPTNNLGGQSFFNAGSNAFNPPKRNRGLLRFDIAAPIPPQSRIQSATLTLQVVHQPRDGLAASAFRLHRVLKPWGEGNKIAAFSSPGLGESATANEATWLHRFAFTTNRWSVPGAAPTTDYSALTSSEQFIYDVSDSPYLFPSTPQLVADVQAWLDRPAENFGWILISQEESVPFTARRFGSSEDPENAPVVKIEFTPPPRIEAALQPNQFALTFTAQPAQSYLVQFRRSLLQSDWIILTNIPPSSNQTNFQVVDPIIDPQRFYRVVIP